METPAITVLTPTVRPPLLPIVEKCLNRQTFKDFEWLVVAPERLHKDITVKGNLIAEPELRPGDYWRLCGAMNKGFALAKGELIVIIMDGNSFNPDMLERFWGHYKTSPNRLITVVGDQYTNYDSKGNLENLMWVDPRRNGQGFRESKTDAMEFSVISIPKQAVIDCGGMDEIYDTCPAVGEKEMALRMSLLGYDMYIDETIEYKAIHHPRLKEDWDEKYFSITAPLFAKHVHELGEGTRGLNVNCLKEYASS